MAKGTTTQPRSQENAERLTSKAIENEAKLKEIQDNKRIAEQERKLAKEEAIEEAKHETRFTDEFELHNFALLGYKGRLPDKLVEIYKDYKRVKDTLRPGRLTPEGFATVVMLHRLA